MARRFNTVTRRWEETGGVFIKDKRIDPVSDAPISDDRFSRFKQRLGDVVSENTPRFIDEPSRFEIDEEEHEQSSPVNKKDIKFMRDGRVMIHGRECLSCSQKRQARLDELKANRKDRERL